MFNNKEVGFKGVLCDWEINKEAHILGNYGSWFRTQGAVIQLSSVIMFLLSVGATRDLVSMPQSVSFNLGLLSSRLAA